MSSTALTKSNSGLASLNSQTQSNQSLSILVNGIETVTSTQGQHVANINLVGGGYTHTQAVPAATWTVNHNLGYRPNTSVFNGGGAEIDVETVHTSINQTIFYFLAPTAGIARFS